MAIVASLDIVMRAITDQADSKLLKSANVLAKLKETLIGAAAAWLSFNTAVRATTNVLEGLKRLDDVAERADKLGMSVNALRAIGNAAELAGTDMENVVKALSKMQQTIGSAVGSSSETVFDRLGLSIQELVALRPEQQFLVLANAIMQLPTAAQQAAAAQEVFGKSARDMVLLFRDAPAAIGEASAFLQRFGGDVSSLDVSKVAAAQDAFDRLRQATQLAWEAMAVRFSPTLIAIAVTLTLIIEKMVNFASVIPDAFETSAGRAALFLGATAAMAVAISTLIVVIGSLTKAFLALSKAQTISQALMGPKGLLTLVAAAGAAYIGLTALEGQISEINADLEKIKENSAFKFSFQAAFDEFQDTLDKVTQPRKVKIEGDPFGFDRQVQPLQLKVQTIQANVEMAERGSQEELAKRFAVEVKTQQQIQVQQLNAQQDGNAIMREMLDEIRKQTDELTEDANL